ncbi:MAG: tail fiber domain-containing protein [Planctomycetota bacterium]
MRSRIADWNVGGSSVTPAMTPRGRCHRPGFRCGAGWALAIVIGLVCGAPSTAADLLTLDGASPTLTFSDTAGTLHEWHIFGNDAGLDIQNVGGGFPFRISPTTLTDSLCIAAGGRIGFGTPNPLVNLHVSTSDLVPTLRLQSTNAGGSRTWDLRASAGGFSLFDVSNSNAAPIVVQAGAPSNTLFLANTGNVGIGTSTPDANSRLDIRSVLSNGLLLKCSNANSHYLRVENSAGIFRSGVQGNGDAQFGALGPTKGLNLLAGGTSKMSINSAGQVSFGNPPPVVPPTDAMMTGTGAHLTTGGVWTDNSSRAAKQDIEPITSEQARDTVRALQPVGYRYKSELDERYVGFIAEDVPELVATRDRKGLAPMDITAVLTKVVQDQDRELIAERETNARQQTLIAELSERLLKLEQKIGDRDTTEAKSAP